MRIEVEFPSLVGTLPGFGVERRDESGTQSSSSVVDMSQVDFESVRRTKEIAKYVDHISLNVKRVNGLNDSVVAFHLWAILQL